MSQTRLARRVGGGKGERREMERKWEGRKERASSTSKRLSFVRVSGSLLVLLPEFQPSRDRDVDSCAFYTNC